MNIDRIAEILKPHEGLQLKPYLCPGMKWTIGYGRNLTGNGLAGYEIAYLLVNRLKRWHSLGDNLIVFTSIDLTEGITTSEAEFLLKNDIEQAYLDAHKAVSVFHGLAPTRQEVLIMMAFNLGKGRFLTFKRMLAAIDAGNCTQAAVEMLDSRWARQVKGRAVELARAMETGEWE